MQSISKNLLPSSFTPGAQNVVIGKGKKYCQHAGNLYLRDIVHSKLSLYLNATSKVSKSCIISSVIDQIHEEGGFFVQLEKGTGRWIKANDYLTREKTSQAFRDALRHQYKSSRQNKRRIQVEDQEAFILHPLLIDDTSSAPEHSSKRRRTENTITLLTSTSAVVTPKTSLSSLEFPVLPLAQPYPYQQYNIMSSTQNEEADKDEMDTNLLTSICSSFFRADDMAGYSNNVDKDTDLFEPIPFDQIMIAPLPHTCSDKPFPQSQQTTYEENACYYESSPLLQQSLVDYDNKSENTLLLRSAPMRIVSDC